MTDQYQHLDRKQKQLFASQYPYKTDIQLFDSTLNNSHKSNKLFGSREDLMNFKEYAAQEDVALQKRRDFIVNPDSSDKSDTISIINSVLSGASEEEYRTAVQLATYEPNPLHIAQGLLAIQIHRLEKGYEYEREANMGPTQETEATMGNAIGLTKLINDIVNGQKVDVQMEGSLSSIIMGMDLTDSDFEEEDVIEVKGEMKNENK